MKKMNLRVGTYGADVSNLHTALASQGFPAPAPELKQGFFGPGTRQAVMTFQAAKGLPKTGEVDAQTGALLRAGGNQPSASTAAAAPKPPLQPRTPGRSAPAGIASTGRPAGAPRAATAATPQPRIVAPAPPGGQPPKPGVPAPPSPPANVTRAAKAALPAPRIAVRGPATPAPPAAQPATPQTTGDPAPTGQAAAAPPPAVQILAAAPAPAASAPAQTPMEILTQYIAQQPAIRLDLVQASLNANPNLSPRWPLPATANLGGLGGGDQSIAVASWEALRTEINTFPGFDYEAALNSGSSDFYNPIRYGVGFFLKVWQQLFDFQTTNIDAFLRNNPQALDVISPAPNPALGAAVTAQLKAYQRIYRVTSDTTSLSNLMGQGFSSARGITLVPVNAFVRRYSGLFGGEAQARRIHGKAQFIAAQAANMYLRVKEAQGFSPRTVNSSPTQAQQGVQQNADWAALFGSTSYCNCSECMAVDGPAAYFVDILQYLGNLGQPSLDTPNAAHYTPLDILIGWNNNPNNYTYPPPNSPPPTNPPTLNQSPDLFPPLGRRPDLAYLKLNCENVDTMLPYVDLVNEIMENFVYYAAVRSPVNVSSPVAGATTLTLSNPAGAAFPPSGTITQVLALSANPPAVQPLTPPINYDLDTDNVTLNLQTPLPSPLTLPTAVQVAITVVGSLPATSNNTPVDATSDQLGVNPEFTLQPVYDPVNGPLASAVYPFSLPFNRPLETARLYLKNQNSSLLELMQTFQANGKPTDLAIACEYLHLSPEELALLAGPGPQGQSSASLAEFYGYPPGTPEATLILPTNPISSNSADVTLNLGLVQNFMSATGLGFSDVVNLLETRFVNPNQQVTLYSPSSVTVTGTGSPGQPTVTQLVDPCDLTYLTFQGLYTDGSGPVPGGLPGLWMFSSGFLRRAILFLRLWKKTGWTMDELDKVFTALGFSEGFPEMPLSGGSTPATPPLVGPIEGLVQNLAGVKWLQQTLNVSVTQVLSLGSTIDTAGRDSLYNSLFQNKAVLNPVDPAFALQCACSVPPGSGGTAASSLGFLAPYAAAITYSNGQLNFTGTASLSDGSPNGPMTLNQLALLLSLSDDAAYGQAVQNLFAGQSPQTVSLPAGLNLPSYLPDAIYCTPQQSSGLGGIGLASRKPSRTQLTVVGAMAKEFRDWLLGLQASAPPPGYQLAIENLYEMRWLDSADVAAGAPISSHLNTILAALQIGASDLQAIAVDSGLIPPGGDLNAFAWLGVGGVVTPGDSVTVTVGFAPQGGLHLPAGVPITHVVVQGDTWESIAAALAARINTTPGLPGGVSARAQAAVINLYATGSAVITPGSGVSETLNLITPPPLTLANLSTLYRYALLAQALNISVPDLIGLKALTGLNPFTPNATTPVTAPLVQFVKAAQMVAASNFSIAQLNYLYRAQPDAVDNLPPLPATAKQLLAGLAAGLQKIAAANAFAPDPKGVALRKKLAAQLPANAVQPAMDLITGSALYTTPLASLPAALTASRPAAAGVPFLTTLVTLGGTVSIGDSLELVFTSTGVQGAPVSLPSPQYIVALVGTSTPTLENIATTLAGAINTALSGVNVSAQAQGRVIQIQTPLSLNPFGAWSGSARPAGSETPVVAENTVRITGTTTAGDEVIVTINYSTPGATTGAPPVQDAVPVSYVVGPADQPADVANGLFQQIKSNLTLSGAGITATPSGTSLTVSAPPGTTILSLAAVANQATETVMVSDAALEDVAYITDITIDETPAPGDNVTLTLAASGVSGPPVTVGGPVDQADSPETIAASLCASINSSPTLQAAGISATAAGAALSIASQLVVDAAPSFSASTRVATESVAVGTAATVSMPGSTTATAGATLTLTLSIPGPQSYTASYTVKAGDGPQQIAAALAAQITPSVLGNAGLTAALDANNNLLVFSPASLGAPVTITPSWGVASISSGAPNGAVCIGGSATAGDIVTLAFPGIVANGQPLSLAYTVAPNDQLENIVAGLCPLITASSALTPSNISSAVPAGNLILLTFPSSPLQITAPTTPPAAFAANSATPGETVAVGGAAPSNLVTIGGTPTVGDTVTLTFFISGTAPPPVSYTVLQNDNLNSIATALCGQITPKGTNIPGISASVVNGTTIVVNSPPSLPSPVVIVASAAGAAPIGSAPVPATEQVTVGGAAVITIVGSLKQGGPKQGDVVTLNVALKGVSAPVSLTYPVAKGDTTTTIAKGLCGLMNSSTTLQGATLQAAGLVASWQPGSSVITLAWAPALNSAQPWTLGIGPADGSSPITQTASWPGALACLGPMSDATESNLVALAAPGDSDFMNAVAGLYNQAQDVLSNLDFLAPNAAFTSPLPSLPSGFTLPAAPPGQVSFISNATVLATIEPQDSLTLTANVAGTSVSLNAAVGEYDTPETIAAGLAVQLNANSTLSQQNISASVSGPVITLSIPAGLTPPVWTPSPSGKINTFTGLYCSTPMTNATRRQLLSLSSDSALVGAVEDLYNQAWGTALQTLINAPETESVADRCNYALQNLLSCLQAMQNQDLVKQTLSQALGLSTSLIALLLQGDPTNDTPALLPSQSLLHAAPPSQTNAFVPVPPSLADFLGGLLAFYCSDGQLQDVGRCQIDPGVNLDGSEAPFVSAQWFGQIAPPTTDTYTFSVPISGGAYCAQLWVNGQLLIDQVQSLPSETVLVTGSAGKYTVSMGGVPGLGDAVSLTFPGTGGPGTPLTVVYTVGPNDTLASIAAGLGNLIGANAALKAADVAASFSNALVLSVTTPSAATFQPIANSTPAWQTSLSPKISLQAGQVYDIQLNLLPRTAIGATAAPGRPQIQLQWSNSTMSAQTIPPTAFILGADPSSAQGLSPSSTTMLANMTTLVQGGAYATLSQLNRIALLVNGLSMKTSEVEYLSDHATDFVGTAPAGSNPVPFDLSLLPADDVPAPQEAFDSRAPALFNQWQRLDNLYKLKAGLPHGGKVGLFDIFQAASESPRPASQSPPVSQTVSTTILQAAGWNAADLAALTGPPPGFNLTDSSFVNETSLVPLAACAALAARLGVSCAQLFLWADNEPTALQAQAIQNTVKAKYTDDTWLQVGTSLNDKIRQSSRDALIAYILANAATWDLEVEGVPVTTADQLYEYFLIDVQMSPCMQTSRLVQATAAVQLFIQRCLMNLENNNTDPALNVAPTQLDAAVWQWMQNYRLWQANREVFLYPENWIDPTLRDDRTPFFQDLQNDLLKGPVTKDNVEQAYYNYLHKLDEVACLEIVGICQDPNPANASNSTAATSPTVTTLHIFGRTTAAPHVYYYRSLVQTYDAQRDPPNNAWTAWERIDVDIQSDQLIPVVWNNRLFIFWPLFSETANQTANPPSSPQATPQPTTYSFSLQMAWSEYRQAAWTKKQVTKETLTPSGFAAYQYVTPTATAPPAPAIFFPGTSPSTTAAETFTFATPQPGGTLVPGFLESLTVGGYPNPGDIVQLQFNFTVKSSNSSTTGSRTAQYTVRAGDKLSDIAAGLYNSILGQISTTAIPDQPGGSTLGDFITFSYAQDQTMIAWMVDANNLNLGVSVSLSCTPKVISATPAPGPALVWSGFMESFFFGTNVGNDGSLAIYMACYSNVYQTAQTDSGPQNTCSTDPSSGSSTTVGQFTFTGYSVATSPPASTTPQMPWPVSWLQPEDMALESLITPSVGPPAAATYAASPADVLLSRPQPPGYRQLLTPPALLQAFTSVAPAALGSADTSASSWLPFVFQDLQRAYLLTAAPSGGQSPAGNPTIWFDTLFHSHVRDLLQRLNLAGLPALLQLENQELSDMLGQHFYTGSDPSQLDPPLTGYHDDGIVGYLFPEAPLDANGNTTTISGTDPNGTFWQYFMYGASGSGGAGTTPVETTPLYGLKRQLASGLIDFFYTTSLIERENAINWYGFADVFPGGILGYVYSMESPLAGKNGSVPLYRLAAPDFAQVYSPDPTSVSPIYPWADVDFTPGGAYSVYNWELFFHIPFLIATQLSQNQRFQDAQTWFQYIFNPTNDAGANAPNSYWNFLPFNQAGEVQTLFQLLQNLPAASAQPSTYSQAAQDLENQVLAYLNNPFDPDAIARLRPVAYQKAVVMAYIDNLIAWGDYLFGQNTRESINEATQIYVLAQQVLGPRPVLITRDDVVQDQTYLGLGPLDTFSDVMVQSENVFPYSSGPGGSAGTTGTSVNNSAVATCFYFCIPPNDQLLGYWDTVADRLYKIRHCMNIQGQVEQLALFAPPINPALLVAAEAAGVDLSSVLNDLSASVPYYRFSHMFAKALELCAEVRSLGGALLSALEKDDAEALALLRANQELAVLKAVLLVKQTQVQEANANVQALQASLAVVTNRQSYYQNLISAGLSPFETGQVVALTAAQVFKTIGQAAQLLAPPLHQVPDSIIGGAGMASPVALEKWGGGNLGDSAAGAAQALNLFADVFSFLATMASLLGQWDRRSQEWSFQLTSAALEIAQVNQQINAANFRATIAQQDLDNQNLQINNASDVLNFLQTKFTNQQLYDWMVSQVSAVYFQCYQLAYSLAKQTEACYRFELGLSDSNSTEYIQFGYWDSLKQGLLSGEKLYLDLKRLEVAYLEQNKREYEITRNISLVLLDPIALITLKETGQCIVNLPEAFLDMDYPGQYLRRIKSLSLTIPCVTGPYTSVNCTLTLVQSRIRWDSTNSQSGYAESPAASDPRFYYNFAASQSIATSTAQNDSGMFEVNFRDERYLPFEGAGAVSQWQLSMPPDSNAFDFETITDVIFHLKYTARDGGAALADAARKAAVMPPPAVQSVASAQPASYPAKQASLVRYFSLKHEFPSEWYQFLHPADSATSQVMSLPLTGERFPFQYRGKKIKIAQVQLFLKFRPGYYPPSKSSNSTPLGDYSTGQPLPVALAYPGTSPPQAAPLVSTSSFLQGVPAASISLPSPAAVGVPSPGQPTPWFLTVQQSDVANLPPGLQCITPNGDGPFLNPAAVDDLFLVCQYSVS